MKFLSVLILSVCILPVSAGEFYDGMYKSLFSFYNIMQPRSFDLFSGVCRDTPDSRLDEYALRWDSFATNFDFTECENWVDSITMEKRAGLERGMISLIDHPDIDSLAFEFAAYTKCYYEWEGCASIIGEEVISAMSYLSENPESPLEPFLILLLMHRLKAQREYVISYIVYDTQPDTLRYSLEADSLQALYDSLFHAVIQYPDSLVTYFARELDSEEFIYIPL